MLRHAYRPEFVKRHFTYTEMVQLDDRQWFFRQFSINDVGIRAFPNTQNRWVYNLASAPCNFIPTLDLEAKCA
jgi:hypothetical protein